MLLDDLQWGDTASLQVIAALAGDRSLRSLLLVGAYRDDTHAQRSVLAHARRPS